MNLSRSLTYVLLPLVGLVIAVPAVVSAAEPARERYDQAIAAERSGDLDGAEGLYRQLLDDYPHSLEAADAAGQLKRIALRREQRHREQFMPVLHRLRQVVLGYRELYGRLPQQLSDFDRDDFPFSSAQVQAFVPPDFVVYLECSPAQHPFTLYALQDCRDRGYRVTEESAALHAFTRTSFAARAVAESPGDDSRLIFLPGE